MVTILTQPGNYALHVVEQRIFTGVGLPTLTTKQPKPLTATEFLIDLYKAIRNCEMPQILPMSGCHDAGASLQRLVDNGFVNIVIDEVIPTEKARVLMIHTAHHSMAYIGEYLRQVAEVDERAESRKPTKPVLAAYEEWLKP